MKDVSTIAREPRTLQWSMEGGYLTMHYPAVMSPLEVDEVEAVLAIAVAGMRRNAALTPPEDAPAPAPEGDG